MSDLPPIEPRDLRNRPRNTENPPAGNYPPSGSNYPPAGGNYPPQGAPNYPPQPSYPPQGGSGYPPSQPSNYPPPGAPGYPPAQQPSQPSAPNYPPPVPPDYPPPNAPRYDPLYEPPPPEADPVYDPVDSGLDDFEAPDLRRKTRSTGVSKQAPSTRSTSSLGDVPVPERRKVYSDMMLTERQVEALGWGVTVVLFGVTILLSYLSGQSNFILLLFPLLGGLILLTSSIYQQMRRWQVSAVTWLTAISLTAFSITRAVAIVDGEPTGPIRSIVYFIATSFIIMGIIVLIRIFRSPNR